MFDRILFEKVSCGLDIGAHSLKASVIKENPQNGQWDILGIFEQSTWGYKDGSVTDLTDFSDCIAQTLNQLSQKTGVKIRDVAVGIGPSFVQVRPIHTMIPLVERGSKIITAKDIQKINQQARLLGVEMEEDCIHDLPLRYQVDNVHSIRNPIGLSGRKLGVHSLMVVSSSNRLRNISKAVNQAGYEVGDLCFGNYLTHHLGLTEEERIKGTLLVDFGESSTTLLLFREGALAFYERIPIGGAHLTKAVADVLQISFDLAEEIKQSYGDLTVTDFLSQEEILVKKESSYLPIRREAIYQALLETSKGLFSQIKDAVAHSGLRDQINCGAVLVGGGASLNGIMEFFESTVFIPARFGRLEVSSGKSVQRAMRFLTVLAVAKSSREDMIGRDNREEGQAWFRRIAQNARHMYQEYF